MQRAVWHVFDFEPGNGQPDLVRADLSATP